MYYALAMEKHEMPVSVRLDEDTLTVLEKTAKSLRISKTEVIKMSIRSFCERTLKERAKKPYELIEDLIGQESSGKGDLSVRGEEILREHFNRER